jgi:hypothetical protein
VFVTRDVMTVLETFLSSAVEASCPELFVSLVNVFCCCLGWKLCYIVYYINIFIHIRLLLYNASLVRCLHRPKCKSINPGANPSIVSSLLSAFGKNVFYF